METYKCSLWNQRFMTDLQFKHWIEYLTTSDSTVPLSHFVYSLLNGNFKGIVSLPKAKYTLCIIVHCEKKLGKS